ncbi:UNVERIFIED_CONTAM: hypothetical protein FKN15_059826 [Acipenser sinensis]
MAQFTGETSSVSLDEPSSASGTQVSPLCLPSSPACSIPCVQAPPSRDRKRARNADQAKDIFKLKGQMAQMLELLARQQALSPAPAPAPPPAPSPEHTLAPPVVAPGISEQDVVMSEEEQDTISVRASWDEESFLREDTRTRPDPRNGPQLCAYYGNPDCSNPHGAMGRPEAPPPGLHGS